MKDIYLCRDREASRTGIGKRGKKPECLYMPEYEVEKLKEAYEDDKMRAIGYREEA